MNKGQRQQSDDRERRRVSPRAFEASLLRVTHQLTSRLSIDGVCQALLDAVEDLVGAASGSVLLHDAESGTLRAVFGRGPVHEMYGGFTTPPGADIAATVFATRRGIFVPDIPVPHGTVPAPSRSADAAAVLMLPLVWQDTAIGVLVFTSPYLSRATPPRADDVARIAIIAAHVTVALMNARMYEESERDRRALRVLLDERRQLRGNIQHLRGEIKAGDPSANVVGSSASLRLVLEQVRQVAPVNATVLLVGETGTGKELLARAIHQQRGRGAAPFVAVNCAALPEALVESELFGHDRGAFTGAIGPKPGRFELAHRGTLFLDEVGDLSLDAQAKLLRAVQEKEIVRVGGTQTIAVDVRVIAATNIDLRAAIEHRAFRSDLYYRLSVFPIHVPPLRDRRDDILPLALHFLRYFAVRMGKRVEDIDVRAAERLVAYDWPGNVRELQNVMERAVLLSSGALLTSETIGSGPLDPRSTLVRGDHSRRIVDAQRSAIEAALERAHGRVSGAGGAADLLNVKPSTLYSRMKKLGIRRP